MAQVFINGKFLVQPTTGVQRYARMVSGALPYSTIIPELWFPHSLTLSAWEVLVLAQKIKHNDLLINLCNAAPINHRNQIVTIHDMAVFENPAWFNSFFAQYYRWLLPRLCRNSIKIVTVSEFSKSEIIRITSTEAARIEVIPGAVSIALLDAVSQKPAEMPNQRFVLMIGSVDPRKNTAFASEHSGAVFQQHGFKLVIVGNKSGNFSKSSVRSEPHVIHLKNQTDSNLKWLYEHCEFVIHAALYEGFSLVPYEALAFGKRALVSNIPVHRAMEAAGIHLFDLDDPNSFLSQMELCLNSEKITPNTIRTETQLGANWESLIQSLS